MSDTSKPEWLKDAQRLELNPGDLIVLRCSEQIPDDVLVRIVEYFTENFPNNKLFIMGGDMDIGVMGPTSDASQESG